MAEIRLLLTDLLEKIAGTPISEIEVQLGELTLGVKRRSGSAAETAASVDRHPESEPEPELVSVDSPIAGIFYASASPTEPAYVSVGDEIAPGQTVGLVEAMKVFNEVVSTQAGTVVSVAKTGTEVQKGTAVVEMEPTG